MSGGSDWLPPLVLLDDYDGNWKRYIEAVFADFYRDFIQSQPQFQGKWVRCRRDPICDGKEAGFWHCVSEGGDEDERTPDLRRCERIGWIRFGIEHARDPRVECWTNTRGRDVRHLLWIQEEFLIVLAERRRKRDGFEYLQLVTAYCTPEEHRRRKLRDERDAARNG